MTESLAEQGFLVKATTPMASGSAIQIYAAGKKTESEALDAVFLHIERGGAVEIGKRLSEQEIKGLGLKPDQVIQYAP